MIACRLGYPFKRGSKVLPLLEHTKIVLQKWQERLEPKSSQWIIGTIRPILGESANQSCVSVSYHFIQVQTRHGLFGKFLCTVGREPTPECHQCDCAKAHTASMSGMGGAAVGIHRSGGVRPFAAGRGSSRSPTTEIFFLVICHKYSFKFHGKLNISFLLTQPIIITTSSKLFKHHY